MQLLHVESNSNDYDEKKAKINLFLIPLLDFSFASIKDPLIYLRNIANGQKSART